MGLLLGVMAPQQEQPTPRQQPVEPRETPAQPNTTVTQGDAYLANWLLLANNSEIALAQIAQQKATDPEVKAFASKMIEDHRQMVTKLQPLASAAGVTGRSLPGDRGLGTDGDRQTPGGRPEQGGERERDNPQGTSGRQDAGRPQNASSRNMQGTIDHVALITDLNDQCLASSRRMLEQKDGAEFDRCYMGMAVGHHHMSKDTLTVFENYATGSLKSVIADAEKTVSTHLAHAESLFKRLDSQHTGHMPDKTRPDKPGAGN